MGNTSAGSCRDWSRIIILMLWLIAMAGCSISVETEYGRPIQTDWTKHVIAASKTGGFEFQDIFPSDYECANDAKPGECQINRVVNALKNKILAKQDAIRKHEEQKIKLIIFIHGGLNTRSTAANRARQQIEQIVADGAYPIFLNWHSGGYSSYLDQVSHVRQGRRINTRPAPDDSSNWSFLQILAMPLYVIADVFGGVGRAPGSWINQGTILLRNYFFGANTVPNEVKAYKKEPWKDITYKNNRIIEEARESQINTYMNRLWFVMTSPAKATTVSFVDSFGKTAWDNMLRRTRAVLRPDSDYTGHEPWVDQRGEGAFAQFMSKLEGALKSYGDLFEVTIIGHSMGTIIANDIIRDYDIKYRNIVYMAAACSVRQFYYTAVPYMKSSKGKRTRFYNLSLHPTAEFAESNWFGALPRGSLLEWIDNMYEESDSDLDRTMGKWVNVTAAQHVFDEEIQRRMIFKTFGLAQGDPTEHGQFDDVLYEDGKVTFKYWKKEHWGKATLFANEGNGVN